MDNYLAALNNIYKNGFDHKDRTGNGRRSLPGLVVKHDLTKGFPLVTTRKVPYKNIFRETKWMLSGSNNIKDLNDLGCKIWDQWKVSEEDIDNFISNRFPDINDTDKDTVRSGYIVNCLDEIGMLYGGMMRSAPADQWNPLWPITPINHIAPDKLKWIKEEYINHYNTNFINFPLRDLMLKENDNGEFVISFEKFASYMNYQSVDQLQYIINELKDNPYSSRTCLSNWNPGTIPFNGFSPQENVLLGKSALAACHSFWQVLVKDPIDENSKPRLTLILYQRSADFPVGVVFNQAQYSFIAMLLAKECNMEAVEFIHMFGDAHIYLNQLDDVKEQLSRDPFELPNIIIPEDQSIYTFNPEDIIIENYNYHPAINYLVSK